MTMQVKYSEKTGKPLVQRFKLATIERAITDAGYTGFCVVCHGEADGVEPDAHGYKCEECGHMTVFGAEEIILRGWVR